MLNQMGSQFSINEKDVNDDEQTNLTINSLKPLLKIDLQNQFIMYNENVLTTELEETIEQKMSRLTTSSKLKSDLESKSLVFKESTEVKVVRQGQKNKPTISLMEIKDYPSVENFTVNKSIPNVDEQSSSFLSINFSPKKPQRQQNKRFTAQARPQSRDGSQIFRVDNQFLAKDRKKSSFLDSLNQSSQKSIQSPRERANPQDKKKKAKELQLESNIVNTRVPRKQKQINVTQIIPSNQEDRIQSRPGSIIQHITNANRRMSGFDGTEFRVPSCSKIPSLSNISQHSIKTPKGILKKDSSQDSRDNKSRLSILSNSKYSQKSNRSKSSKSKNVKFLLSKKQARQQGLYK